MRALFLELLELLFGGRGLSLERVDLAARPAGKALCFQREPRRYPGQRHRDKRRRVAVAKLKALHTDLGSPRNPKQLRRKRYRSNRQVSRFGRDLETE